MTERIRGYLPLWPFCLNSLSTDNTLEHKTYSSTFFFFLFFLIIDGFNLHLVQVKIRCCESKYTTPGNLKLFIHETFTTHKKFFFKIKIKNWLNRLQDDLSCIRYLCPKKMVIDLGPILTRGCNEWWNIVITLKLRWVINFMDQSTS